MGVMLLDLLREGEQIALTRLAAKMCKGLDSAVPIGRAR
jgi:hypothetical protein